MSVNRQIEDTTLLILELTQPKRREMPIMRSSAIACLFMLFALSAVAGIGGASVTLLSPAIVAPGQTYTFTFLVQNTSADGESITNVAVSFPDGFTLFPATMSYVPLVPSPLRPDWDMYVPTINHTARWDDANGGMGELYGGESTTIAIDVKVADVLYGSRSSGASGATEWARRRTASAAASISP